MTQRVVVIPLVVFFVTLIVACVLTVFIFYVWDQDPALPAPRGTRANPPFPTAAPIVVPPETDPLENVCVTFVGDANGAYVPSPLQTLRPCKNDSECEGCVTSPLQKHVKCVDGETWEGVDAAQSALNNSSSKFCLPRRSACLPPASDALMACAHDMDCAHCNDELGGFRGKLTCNIVSTPQLILRDTNDGVPLNQSELEGLTRNDVIEVPKGQWCLPSSLGIACDAENGILEWTSEGWNCRCRYPSVHGGDACDVMLACNNFITTPWSRDKQQLLLNDATDPPEVWTVASGVNPTLCHYDGTPREEWNEVCDASKPELLSNTVCQCDGLMLGSYTSFRSEVDDPLTCTPDSCSFNALGGRAREPLALSTWSADTNVPPNQCICSGAGSRLWDSDPRDPESVEASGDPDTAALLRAQEGYIYKGRCEDVTLPNSVVKLVADPEHVASDVCGDVPNTRSDVTGLVPGYAQDTTGTASVAVCSADPCRGVYSDQNFSPPSDVKYLGHYDAQIGMCSCNSPAASVRLKEACDYTVNPVCTTCVNACTGMESEDPDDWPCRLHGTRPCRSKPECVTDENGFPTCLCPSGCGNIDGFTCAEQFLDGTGCKGFLKVPNICKPVNGVESHCECHQNRKKNLFGLSCQDGDNFYAKCTTSRSNFKCGGSSVFGGCGGSPCPEEEGCDDSLRYA